MTAHSDIPIPPVPEECAHSMDLLQRILDGELPISVLDFDPHGASCRDCHERIGAARVVLCGLALPAHPALPAGLTESIVAAIRDDRFSRIRRRSLAVVGVSAIGIAASLLVAGWLASPNGQPEKAMAIGSREEVISVLPEAPEPRQARLSEEFARVGHAIVASSKPIIEPVADAPAFLDLFSTSFTFPTGSSFAFEPTRHALAELPGAARIGLEPVTATTQRALTRLMRDVGAVQVSTNPKQ